MSTSVRSFLAGALVVTLAACGDATAPQPLDAAGKTALTTALTTSGALSATPLAAVPAVLVNTLSSTGALATADNANAFDAVGVEIIYDVTSGGTHTVGTFSGVFGWTGLNASSNSVDALIEAVIATNTSTPATGTVNVGPATSFPVAEALYASRTTSGTYTSYLGATGSVTVTAADFSGTNSDCAGGVAGLSCNVTSGTMSGSFAFGAAGITNPALTFQQPNTTFTTIPAVKIQITVTH
jgi:hypothetical protein